MKNTRSEWIHTMIRTVEPVLSAMSKGQLTASMPAATRPNGPDREEFKCLEALGRLFAGISPWLARTGGE